MIVYNLFHIFDCHSLTVIIIIILGYIEASGSTTVNLQPGEPLMLTTAVSQQYSSHSKSPLLNNVRVETEWRHNGIRVNSTAPIEELNLLIDNVQEANTGMYKLSVSHFYFTQYENGTDIPPLVGNQDRLCSRIILDVLSMYAIFSLVEFQVSIGKQHSEFMFMYIPPSIYDLHIHNNFNINKVNLILHIYIVAILHILYRCAVLL